MQKKEEISLPHRSSDKLLFLLIKIVFFGGVLLFTISSIYHFHLLNRLSFSKSIPPAPVAANNIRTSLPVSIKIVKVNIDLPIYQTSIAKDTWEIAEDGISHLDISGRPGENNTIILYGHNTKDRFGPIRWLAIGDSIEVESKESKTYSYIINDIKEVNPDATDILISQKEEALILYTCSGFADQKRYIIIAKPE